MVDNSNNEKKAVRMKDLLMSRLKTAIQILAIKFTEELKTF